MLELSDIQKQLRRNFWWSYGDPLPYSLLLLSRWQLSNLSQGLLMCAAVCEVEIKWKQILDPVVPQDAGLLLHVLTLLCGLSNISKHRSIR